MKLTLAILTFLWIGNSGYSQGKTISGETRNYENNELLAYVNIGIANKTVGTISNKNGLFKLFLNDNDMIKISIVLVLYF